MTDFEAQGTEERKIHRRIALALLGVSCVLLTLAGILGIADNPPGLALCALAVSALILALVHAWTRKRLLILAGASLAGVIVFAVLHNLFDALTSYSEGSRILSHGLEVLSMASFLIAILVCPPAILVGLVGALLSSVLAKRSEITRSMVLFLATSMVIAGLAALAIIAPGGRIVVMKDKAAGFNGSFEATKSGFPSNWYVYNTTIQEGEVVVSFDTEEMKDGKQSLRFIVNPSYKYVGWRPAGLFQFIPADPGKSYRITFWLKSQECRCMVKINSNEEAPTGSELRETFEPTETWRQVEHLYTVPMERTSIRWDFHILEPGNLWIDDIRIQQVQSE